jgi:HK97 family phage major capsid protein
VALTAELKGKIEKLETLRVRARAIMAEHKAGLPPEQDQAVSKLLTEATALRAEIESEQKVAEKNSDINDLSRFLDEPIRNLRHGINGDDDDRKSLVSRGWEFKGGMAYAPTSLGKHVEMFGEDVLLGDIPTNDPAAQSFYKTTRASMSQEYKQAYVRLIRLTATSPDGSAYARLSGTEQKALSEGTDTAGGFTVPPDVQAEMLVRTAQMAVMRRYARVQTTNRDILQWFAVKANATYGSIYSSGFVGSWAGETPAFTDVDPAFQRLDIPVKKLRVATKLSNDFIADSATNILSFMAQNGAENMALTEDLGFISGDGTALQPTGILNCGLTTFDVEGSTSNLILNTTSNTGSAPKIIAGAYKLPAQYVSNARWLMCRSIEGKVAALVDANGRPFWAPNAGSGYAPVPRQIQGFPVENSDWMPDDGTDANKVLLVGDFSNYIIAQRAQITSVVLRERFADTDQTGIILWERVGGNCFNTDAFRVGIV